MLLEKKLLDLLHNPSQEEEVTISVDGSDVTIRVFDFASKLSLQTPVYHGGNYIPKSVRNSLSQKISSLPSELHTYFTIDEGQFKVSINYLGLMRNINKTTFRELLEKFTVAAELWRHYLDEQDRNDLLHISVK